MALTLSGTNGVVGAGFTLDASGASVTAGVGTFSSVRGTHHGDGHNLTSINAANLVGVCTSGLTKTGGFGEIIQWVSTTKEGATSFSVDSQSIYHYTDSTLRVTITPTSASNFLYIMGHVVVGRELLNWMHIGISKDGAVFTQANGDSAGSRRLCTVMGVNSQTDMPVAMPFHAKVTAENTSERYYSLNFSHGSSSTRTIYLNRGSTDTDSVYYPRGISTITVIEVKS